MLGFRTDVDQLLAQSDIFAMTTRFEGGTSVSLLEACEAGLPVVVTALPAIRDLLGHVPGASLVPIDDAEATRRAIERYLAMSPRQRREAGASVKAATAHLTIDAVVASTRRRLAALVPSVSLQHGFAMKSSQIDAADRTPPSRTCGGNAPRPKTRAASLTRGGDRQGPTRWLLPLSAPLSPRRRRNGVR